MEKKILLIGLFTLLFLSVEGFVIAFSRPTSPDAYQNPFAAYADILPGKPSSALDHYRCQFQMFEGRAERAATCDLQAEGGVFYAFTVLTRSGIIQEITFRTDRLLIGDVLRQCGHSSIAVAERKTGMEHWSRVGNCLVFVPSGAFSYLLPVQYVLLSGK